METIEVIATYPEAHQTQAEVAIQHPGKISVEKVKKLQLIMMTKQFFFYSAFFDFIEKCIMNMKSQAEDDVEGGSVQERYVELSDVGRGDIEHGDLPQGDVDQGVADEPRQGSGFKIWSKIYDAENKTYFGKKGDVWLNFLVWLVLTFTVAISAGAVVHLWMKYKYAAEC